MNPWTPISHDELEKLVAAQLAECAPEQATQFGRLRVPFRTASLSRQGVSESVFVVAQLEQRVVFYEDVEEGFNVSELAPDGAIVTPGFEHWTLGEAIQHLVAFARDGVRRGPACALR